LKQLKIKINVLWGFIITLTESKGSTNSKEERDISIGRIFGVMAIVNSGMIKKTGIQLQDFKEIVDFLIKSFHFKVYLRIPAMEVLLSLLEDIKQESIGEEGISYSILKGIKTGNEVEEIWMIIRLQNSLQVKYDWETLLQEWINGDPLERQNLKKLVSVLQDSTILNPDLHPIWEDIFMNLIPQAQKKTIKKRITTLELWTLLEKTLFNSTHERKCLGFGIFNYLLKNLPQEDVVTIFGQNFTRCLMNNLSNKETYLNKVARETAEQISLKAEESKNIALDLLLQLIGPYGSLSFDSISKTKTVDKILNNLSPEQVRGYITHLKGLFMNQGGGQEETVDTRKGPDVVRSRILDQLVALFKIQGIEKDEGWIKEIIKFLVHHGFFSVSNPTQEMEIAVPPISHKTQTYARVKLESVLGFLHSITLNKYTERKYRGLMLDGEPWARYVIDTMDVFKASDAYNSLIEFDESVERIIGKTGKLLKSIRKKKGSLTKENVESTKIINQLNCFESLISHVLIQSYSDPSDLTALIDDFEECFANLWPKESRPKKRKSIESGETNIVPIDVLVDIFLSLLSKPSAPLRALILDIFKVFSSMISEKSLEIIFEVLKSANGPAGSEDIFEEEDDFEQISEVEKMEEDHSSSTEDSEEDSNMEVIEEKVMEEDNGMNDGEMEEYDLKLAAIFKQRSLDQTQKKGRNLFLNI
jgi:DNA polymerase phi